MKPFTLQEPDSPVPKQNLIHPSVIIHPAAEIAESVEIGPYTIIGEDVKIGPKTKIGSHCVIEFSDIGSACRIYSHAFVGTEPQDLKYRGEKTKIIIGDGTIIRECATLNRGTSWSGRTQIGRRCLLMAYSHVAHDCTIEDEVILANSVAVAGHVSIGSNTVIGGLSGIHQFVKIGKLVMVGAGSMVPMDVPPFCVVWGDRARIIGLNTEGMRRRHYSTSSVDLLKRAYKKVFLSGKTLKNAIRQIKSEKSYYSKDVKEFVSFIQQASRGICRPKLKAETSASQTW